MSARDRAESFAERDDGAAGDEEAIRGPEYAESWILVESVMV